MAVTMAQKQAFLESYGEVKSLSYFMTGPNLGSDWSWSKALAGGYSQDQVTEYLEKGKVAYAAHKNKDAKTPPPTPADGPDTPGVGAACAKTAAKQITTALSDLKQVVYQTYFNNFPLQGLKILDVSVLDEATSLQKKLMAIRQELISELGEAAPEVLAADAALESLRAVHDIKVLLDVLDEYSLAASPATKNDTFVELLVTRKALGHRLGKITKGIDDVNEILGDTVASPGDALYKLVADWADEVVEKTDEILKAEFLHVFPDLGDDYFTTIQKLAQAGIYDLDNGAEILNKIFLTMDEFALEMGFADAQVLISQIPGTSWLGSVRFAVKEVDDQIKAKMLDLISPEDWLGGVTLQPGSPITKYATFDDFVAQLNLYEQNASVLEGVNIMSSFDEIAEVTLASVEEAFDAAKLTANQQIPGAVTDATKFDADMVLAAGTDELNPMVQTVLEEQGETPSLVYFMTKQQKQDLLIDAKQFQQVNYQIKYKGQTLEGYGLETAKLKYAAKQGSPPPKATVHAEKMTGTIEEAVEKTTPPITNTGVDPVTGTPTPLPPDAPKWWADPYTDKQGYFLESLVSKNGLEGTFEDAGFYEAVAEGLMTKGKMSLLIDAVDNDLIQSVDDVVTAMNYGKPLGTAVDEAIAAVEAAGKTLEDVLAPTVNGPTVSGVKQATAVAPDNPVWDAPHTFTYKGDGQSKWGGAHRKWWFEDEEGNDWMLKHGEGFRSEGELAAHRIAHVAGYDIAEARIVNLSVGMRRESGVIQKMYRSSDVVGTLDDATGHGGLAGLNDNVVRQLQEHQVLDWLLGNHDSHMQNFLLLKDGRLVGVDKGQAFKFYGKDRLAHDYKPDGNFGEIAYNRMWAEYRAGNLDLDLNVIDDALSRIEAMSDEQLFDLVGSYAVGRFQGGSQAFLQGTTANTAEELLELIAARKRNIREEFTTFYREQAEARGVRWDPSWDKVNPTIHAAKPKVINAHDILSPIDDEFAASLNRVGTNGKAVYVAGTEVERGQILFDVVTDDVGNKQLRMHAYLRPDGDSKLMELLRTEGGDAIIKNSGITSDVPTAVNTVAGWSQKTVAMAKTVNHHVSSGDFQFNASTLKEAVDTLGTIQKNTQIAKWVNEGLETVEAIEDKYPTAFVVDEAQLRKFLKDGPDSNEITEYIEAQATAATTRRAGMTYRSHLLESINQAGRANQAQKVDLVPDFDAVSYYKQVRDKARKVADEILEGVQVEVVEAPKRFTRVFTERIQTTAVQKEGLAAGLNDPTAVMQGWVPIPGTGSAQQFGMEFTINGKKVRAAYRSTDTNSPTLKGWLEVVVDTEDSADVTTADIEALHRWLNESVGVSAKLANATDAELTYWRLVQGNYRVSKTAQHSSSSYRQAVDLADQRLQALGPSPTQEQEIEAIRGAYRQVFGAQVDDADVLPIHSHMASPELDEIGWGYWERPELADREMADAVGDKVLTHSIHGSLTPQHASAATGQGLTAQQDRLRQGFISSAMSAESDLQGGGASGFFTRLQSFSTAGSGYGDRVIFAPHRRIRRLLDYNAPRDTFGRVADRTSEFALDLQTIRSYSQNSGNEFMLRDLVSYFDDVELVFFSDRRVRDAWVKLYRERGVGEIRGVPIEGRLIVNGDVSATRYIEDHFKRYVNPRERLRRPIEALRSGVSRGAQAAQTAVQRVASRFPTVKAGRIRKQVSAGRSKLLRINRPGEGYLSLQVRYHTSENAISIPGSILDDSLQKFFAPGSSIPVKGAKVTISKDVGKGIEASPAGEFTMLDMSPFGIDLKEMSADKRPRFMRAILEALVAGDEQVITQIIHNYGGSIV